MERRPTHTASAPHSAPQRDPLMARSPTPHGHLTATVPVGAAGGGVPSRSRHSAACTARSGVCYPSVPCMGKRGWRSQRPVTWTSREVRIEKLRILQAVWKDPHMAIFSYERELK